LRVKQCDNPHTDNFAVFDIVERVKIPNLDGAS
jgi:hypothetical protein